MCLHIFFRYLAIGVLVFICVILRMLVSKAGIINTSGAGILWGPQVLAWNQEKKNLVLTHGLQEDLEPAVQQIHSFMVLDQDNSFHEEFNFVSSSKHLALCFSMQRIKMNA